MADKEVAEKAPAVPQLVVTADPSGASLVVNGVECRLTVQEFLNLRREINNLAAGLVH